MAVSMKYEGLLKKARSTYGNLTAADAGTKRMSEKFGGSGSKIKKFEIDTSKLKGNGLMALPSLGDTDDDQSSLDLAYQEVLEERKVMMGEIEARHSSFSGGDYDVASQGKFNAFGTMLVEIDSDETAAYTDPAYGLTEELYGSKGSGKGGIVEQSYFNLALPKNSTSTSRSAGATTKAMKQKVIDLIINTGYQAGMTDVEVATTLAIAAHESGFNPEASARESSASGVGQFVNKTGADYGLTDSNRWDLDMQVQALVDHTKDNFIIVKNRGLSQDYVYALHHDGQTVVSKQGYSKTSAPGLKTSRKKVAPLINKYLTFVRSR